MANEGMNPIPEKSWECPLLKQRILEGLCVDIYEAMYGGLDRKAVPEVNDWKKAKRMCPVCKHFFERDDWEDD